MLRFVTPRSVVLATVAACVAAVAALGMIVASEIDEAQHHSRVLVAEAFRVVPSSLDKTEDAIAQAQGDLEAATALLASSEGKTLDTTARDALSVEIENTEAALELVESRFSDSSELALSLLAELEQPSLWPPDNIQRAEQAIDLALGLDAALAREVQRLKSAMAEVADAQAAWQAEQDRIAAEAAEAARRAAAEAAARRAAAGGSGSLGKSGGSTQPIVQAAPPTSVPVAAQMQYAEAFLRQYVSTGLADLAFDPVLCQPGYICGTTTIGWGTPLITLMGGGPSGGNYDGPAGRYVLIHEAAHARQWALYGSVSAMRAASAALAPPVPASWDPATNGPPENWPIEYMADCATQARSGAVGTYVRGYAGLTTCTPQQLAEASRVWGF